MHPRRAPRSPLTASCRAALSLLALVFLAPTGSGQATPGEVLLASSALSGAGGAISVVDPATGVWSTVTNLPPGLGRPQALVSDPLDRGRIFVGAAGPSGSCQVWELLVASGSVQAARPLLPTPVVDLEVTGLELVGDELFLLTPGALRRLPVEGGAAQLVMPFPATTPGRVFTTDGRRLFASITPRQIYVLDLLGPPAPTLFATLPGSLGAIQDLVLDENGDLLVADAAPFQNASVVRFDRSTGEEIERTWLSLEVPIRIGRDAVRGGILVAGLEGSTTWIDVLQGGRRVGHLGSIAAYPEDLEVVQIAAVDLSGPGCAAMGSRVPDLEPVGVPVLGNAAFGLHLFHARTGPSALLLGGPSPLHPRRGLDLQLAPGCVLAVDPLVAIPVFVPPSGEASLTFALPADPFLRGAAVDGQWWSVDPNPNGLGVTATQRVTIRVE